MGCNNLRDSSLQAATPGHSLHRQQDKTHIRSFLWKRPFSYPRVLPWEVGYRCWWAAFLCHPPASLQLPGISQNGVYIWSPNFYSYCSGNTSTSPGFGGQWSLHCGLTGLYIFAYFKRCCLRVWLPVSLNLDASWDPSLWNTDWFWHTLNYWELLKTK